jgi:FkbM family methyltransferase
MTIFILAVKLANGLISDFRVGNINKSYLTDQKIMVETDTLDNILDELHINEVDFIKIDIKGAEIEALKGAEKTLGETFKIVVACYHERAGERTMPIITQMLSKHGFKQYQEWR